MSEQNKKAEQKEEEFPREITFKVVFRTKTEPLETIKSCLIEHELEYTLTEKISGKSSFISYTISAHYESEALLDNVCQAVASIDGYMMMV